MEQREEKLKTPSETNYIEAVREYFNYKENPPLAHVHSFGCQQNAADGERFKGLLMEMGYGFTDDLERADLILYNTCAVRENAEDRVYGNIGELKHLKAKNPDLVVCICGCMTQQEHVAEKIKNTYRQVDLVCGTFAMKEFPKLLFEVLSSRKRVFYLGGDKLSLPEGIPAVRDGNTKAYVSIMYGRNNFCTYCIVPYVRGRERSRKPEDIIAEIQELSRSGCREIMLLGQNVNSYGKGLEEEISFSELLRRIDKIEGDFKIRFMSSHPKDISHDLIDAIFECEKVCKHLHLPLQSGSDEILAAMNRRYTAYQYLSIVSYAREKDPDFSFSTDIIVGFPNETEEDFQKTLDIMKEVGFDNIFSYIYSKRSGTKAAEIEDLTEPREKTERMRRLLSLQREIATTRYHDMIGKTLTVLAEAKGKTEGYLTGKSDEFIIVEMEGSEEHIGQYVKVKITGAHNWALVGKII